ncbi:MAG: PAC2 family protein [Dehalococcoidia bacterium]|nr:PAC2 family protein [Dehalococcoidia bacterium]
MEAIRLDEKPKLRNPFMLAAWPGMGGVAIIAARYLTEKWGAKEFGSIAPEGFFDLSGVLIEDNQVRDLEFPENKFYLSRSRGRRDWIIFIGEAQPLMNGYRLANLVLDVAQNFGVKRLYTFAAAPTHIYHTKKPGVLAVATMPKLVRGLEKYDVTLLKQGSISGLNGLLLGAAKQRNIPGICLLGEIPIYTTHIANPRSAKAVLQVLAQMSNFEIDLTDIDNWSRETVEEIEAKIYQLKESFGEEAKELIEYFTRLAEQTSEEELGPEFKTEELLKEIERFLKDKGEQKGGN